MGKKRSNEEAANDMREPSKKLKDSSVSSCEWSPRVQNDECKQEVPQHTSSSQIPNPINGTHGTHNGHSNSSDPTVQSMEDVDHISPALNFAPTTTNPQASTQNAPSIKPVPPYTGHPSTLPPLPPILSESLQLVPFTHPGYVNGKASSKLHTTYDRLEILGDAYIEVIAMRHIFKVFPNQPAGRLSQHRELCVKNETLSEYAHAYGFDKQARLPPHITKGDRKIWIKTMGDIFEAYVGAIIISNPETGFQIAEAWLTALWQNKLSPQNSKPAFETQVVDPHAKNELAKKVVSRGVTLAYVEEAPPTAIRDQGKVIYHMAVKLTGFRWQKQHLGSGSALSKTDAGCMAASNAMKNPLIEEIIIAKQIFDADIAAEKAARGEGEGVGKIMGQMRAQRKVAIREEMEKIKHEKEEALKNEIARIQAEKEEALKKDLDNFKFRKDLERDLVKS